MRRIALRFLKHIPGLAFLFYRIVYPIWNWTIATLEALLYFWWRSSGIVTLRHLRATTISPGDLARWYNETAHFKWSRDPLGGALDFRSKPWVSCLKLCGDCDDMMELSYHVLRNPGVIPPHSEVRRAFVYKADGSGHALLLIRLKETGLWDCMSNQSYIRCEEVDAEAAARGHYVEDAYFVYVW